MNCSKFTEENPIVQSIDNTPKCNDRDVVNAVVGLWAENKNNYIMDVYFIRKKPDRDIQTALNELWNSELEHIITLEVNKELKSCKCKADVKLSPMLEEFNEKDYNWGGLFQNDQNATISYSVETDSEGEIIVSLYE